jgi:hypothetical protein
MAILNEVTQIEHLLVCGFIRFCGDVDKNGSAFGLDRT